MGVWVYIGKADAFFFQEFKPDPSIPSGHGS